MYVAQCGYTMCQRMCQKVMLQCMMQYMKRYSLKPPPPAAVQQRPVPAGDAAVHEALPQAVHGHRARELGGRLGGPCEEPAGGAVAGDAGIAGHLHRAGEAGRGGGREVEEGGTGVTEGTGELYRPGGGARWGGGGIWIKRAPGKGGGGCFFIPHAFPDSPLPPAPLCPPSQEEWTAMCDALATRLASAGLTHAASLCHVCAGNVEGAVSYWGKAATSAAVAAARGSSGGGAPTSPSAVRGGSKGGAAAHSATMQSLQVCVCVCVCVCVVFRGEGL